MLWNDFIAEILFINHEQYVTIMIELNCRNEPTGIMRGVLMLFRLRKHLYYNTYIKNVIFIKNLCEVNNYS